MDSEAARRWLDEQGLSFSLVEPIVGGWASWTFELDGELIVRFPRNADIVEAMHREMRLLPALASHVSFRVPVPTHATDDWFVYEKIPGRAFEMGDDEAGARAMIDELHTFPVDAARQLLQRPTWTEQFAWQWELFSEVALPTLPPELVDRVTESYVLPDCPETFVHNDLGLEHVIVDTAGSPVGIIDFEDATVGDPEVDLVPLHATLGLPLTERMWFYRWVGALHAIVHHVWEDEPHEVAAATAELRRRLDSRPER